MIKAPHVLRMEDKVAGNNEMMTEEAGMGSHERGPARIGT
jgi:hypothetical protein